MPPHPQIHHRHRYRCASSVFAHLPTLPCHTPSQLLPSKQGLTLIRSQHTRAHGSGQQGFGVVEEEQVGCFLFGEVEGGAGGAEERGEVGVQWEIERI